MSELGWKFTINLPPRVYQDHVIVYKPRPHARESEESQQLRWEIENQIRTFIEEPFTIPVKLELDFYMPTLRIAYPTSVAHATARCLVPALIAEPRLIREVTSRVHYNSDERKDWKPRTELVIIPVGTTVE